jgi:hypothetical protein
MCPSLSPEQLFGFYSYPVFKGSSIMGRCPVNTGFLATKILGLQSSTDKRNGEFIDNGSNHCARIPVINADRLPK